MSKTDPPLQCKPEKEVENEVVIAGIEVDRNISVAYSESRKRGLIGILRQWNRFVIKEDNPLRHIRIVNGIGMYITYLTITFMVCDYLINYLIHSISVYRSLICQLSIVRN